MVKDCPPWPLSTDPVKEQGERARHHNLNQGTAYRITTQALGIPNHGYLLTGMELHYGRLDEASGAFFEINHSI